MEFDELVRKAIEHHATIDSSIRDIKDNTLLISKREEELKNLNELYKTTKFSYAYLDTLVKEESGKFIKRLNEILDYGVKTIFDDCNYSIEIRVSDNNKAVIHLVYDDEEGNKLEPDIQDCGGGLRSIVGILTQIFFIFHYKVEPIIFIDEGLSQISTEYVFKTMSLLKELAKKNNLKIMLITHDNRFIPYADTHYVIEDGHARSVAVSAADVIQKELEESEVDVDESNTDEPTE